MSDTKAKESSGTRLIDTIEDAERASLEAVRKFVDTVDGVFPALGDDAPRRKIIDAAFRMTENLVGASNRLAQNVLDVTEKELEPSRAEVGLVGPVATEERQPTRRSVLWSVWAKGSASSFICSIVVSS